MDHRGNIEEVQKKANAFLRDLLDQSAARSSEEIIQSITNLAFEDGNPVRDLFLTAIPSALTPSTVPTRSVKPRSSSRLLRLGRRENKTPSAESKTPAPNQQAGNQKPVHASTSSNARSDESPAQSCFPTVESSSKESGTVLYNCIICNEDMSSKGVCKRHLDEQHVSPKIFKCERCGENFTTKADAKKHCNRCGLGVFTWGIVKPPAKRIYASEFTEEWFSSKSTYLEHLLRLSKKGAARIRPSLHCKLRALLSHPNLHQHVDSISQRVFGATTAWRSMRWADEQLERAIEQLEAAAVVHENGMIDFGGYLMGTQKALDVHNFLENLLCASTLSVSNNSQPMLHDTEAAGPSREDRQSSMATTISGRTTPPVADTSRSPNVQMDQPYLDQPSVSPRTRSGDVTNETTFISQEVKVKRHLSDDSRFYEPTREPPGPPGPLGPPAAPIHFEDPFNTQRQVAQSFQHSPLNPTNLPYRSQEGSVSMQQAYPNTMTQIPPYPPLALVDVPLSATASETTLVSPNYREPEFLETTSVAYNLWSPQQSMNYVPNIDQPDGCGISYLSYQGQSDTSMRTPSIATDQTCVDMGEPEQKLESYGALASYPASELGPYLMNNINQPHFHGMSQ